VSWTQLIRGDDVTDDVTDDDDDDDDDDKIDNGMLRAS